MNLAMRVSEAQDVLKRSVLEVGDSGSCRTSQGKAGQYLSPNELHITGDLLASNEDSLRFAPDFSLEDPDISLRCPKK